MSAAEEAIQAARELGRWQAIVSQGITTERALRTEILFMQQRIDAFRKDLTEIAVDELATPQIRGRAKQAIIHDAALCGRTTFVSNVGKDG